MVPEFDRTRSFSSEQPSSESSDHDRSALDLTVLALFRQEMGETGREVIIELIACYLAEVPQLLQTIDTAVSQRDREEVQRVAHGLKASSASLGALCLGQLCRELETIAPSASIDQIAIVFARTKFEFNRVEAALRHEQLHQPL